MRKSLALVAASALLLCTVVAAFALRQAQNVQVDESQPEIQMFFQHADISGSILACRALDRSAETSEMAQILAQREASGSFAKLLGYQRAYRIRLIEMATAVTSTSERRGCRIRSLEGQYLILLDSIEATIGGL